MWRSAGWGWARDSPILSTNHPPTLSSRQASGGHGTPQTLGLDYLGALYVYSGGLLALGALWYAVRLIIYI